MQSFKQNLENDIKNLENYVNNKYYDANKLFPNISIAPDGALLKRDGCYFAVGRIDNDSILNHKQQLINDVYLNEFKMLFPKNSIHKKYLPDTAYLQKKMRYVNIDKSDGSGYTIIN